MALSNIGQNSAEEFFETILYNVAYDKAKTQIDGMTNSIDNSVVQEAVQGAMTVLTSGLIFLLMRKQEEFIEGVFKTTSELVLILLGSSFAQKMKNRLSGLRGGKLSKMLNIFKSSYSDRVATAQLVVNASNNQMSAERTSQSDTSSLGNVMQMKEHLVNKESHNHAVGSSKADSYNKTLMFKLFTKSFTTSDEALMKKMLGRDSASSLNVEDMNKVADFMFVTDNNGDVTGLSEQMFQLINGLGYVHK